MMVMIANKLGNTIRMGTSEIKMDAIGSHDAGKTESGKSESIRSHWSHRLLRTDRS